MRGSLIYSHDSGLAFEIERYEDMSRVGQKMWRYRQRDMNHDWSQDWSRPDLDALLVGGLLRWLGHG